MDKTSIKKATIEATERNGMVDIIMNMPPWRFRQMLRILEKAEFYFKVVLLGSLALLLVVGLIL